MRKKSLLAVAVCTAALAGVSANAALAGEVKGPPGTFTISQHCRPRHMPTQSASFRAEYPGRTGRTTPAMVQTPGEFMKDVGTPPGVPGHGTTDIPGFEKRL